MKLIEKQLEEGFKEAIQRKYADFNDWSKLFIQKTNNEQFGDFQTNQVYKGDIGFINRFKEQVESSMSLSLRLVISFIKSVLSCVSKLLILLFSSRM